MKTNLFYKKLLFGKGWLVLLGILLVFPAGLNASEIHRYHTSLTRMDFNYPDQIIEITVQLFTHDLKKVFENQTRKPVDLENNDRLEEFLKEYLNKNFVFRNEDNSARNPVWVGKEIKADVVYIYLETPIEDGVGQLRLKNTIFFESFAGQANLVVAYEKNQKADLVFKVGDQFKELKFVPTGVE